MLEVEVLAPSLLLRLIRVRKFIGSFREGAADSVCKATASHPRLKMWIVSDVDEPCWCVCVSVCVCKAFLPSRDFSPYHLVSQDRSRFVKGRQGSSQFVTVRQGSSRFATCWRPD